MSKTECNQQTFPFHACGAEACYVFWGYCWTTRIIYPRRPQLHC